jgi:dienelactone hydrolase
MTTSTWLLALTLAAFQEKTIPPPGVPLSPAETESVRSGLASLEQAMAGLPPSRHRIDVEVIRHALSDALAHGEFMDKKDVQAAKDLSALGVARAADLKAGRHPWTASPGLLPLGYVSRIDDSAQPYGLVIPPGWKPGGKPMRLDLWLHGRDEKLTQLRFLASRLKSAGEFAPPDAIVLHLYGRFCNAFKFAGETDVLEALADVRSRYAVDENRILLRGFSMGGAGAWYLGTRHAGLWAAVAPGAGFAETEIYANVARDPVPPSPWQRTLWRFTDATVCAGNLFNVPVVAYSGEEDKQKQAADIMAAALGKEGLELTHLIGPKTGHKYEPETKKELIRRLDEIAARGRDPNPRQLRLVTYTLRHAEMKWLRLEGLDRHGEEARVDASVEGGVLDLRTRNVSAFAASPKPSPAKVRIDGQELPFAERFRRSGDRWIAGGPPEGLRKRPGLQGPIDDAFTDRFILVTPSGKPMHAETGAWVDRESRRAAEAWRSFFRGNVRTCRDQDLTAKDVQESNLVLWGDPSSNTQLARVLPGLPIRWTSTELSVGAATADPARHVPALIHPNPLNPKRYVVLNSGFTFIDQRAQSNSRHVAVLPDWALIDAGAKGFANPVQAGFFDEEWRPR